MNNKVAMVCWALITFALVGCSTSQSASNTGATQNTVSTTSNQTVGSNNETPPAVNDNSSILASSSQPNKITSSSQATELINTLYSATLKSNPNTKIALVATDESGSGQIIYQFHVFTDTAKGSVTKT